MARMRLLISASQASFQISASQIWSVQRLTMRFGIQLRLDSELAVIAHSDLAACVQYIDYQRLRVFVSRVTPCGEVCTNLLFFYMTGLRGLLLL